MMGSNALESASLTTLILLPEIILLLTGMGMMTASAFVASRERGGAVRGLALLAATVALLFVARYERRDVLRRGLNDSMSFWSRLVLLLTGLIVIGLAHDEPADDRAGEFFGALLIINAGSMLVAAANELVFLFVGLELVSIPTYLLLYLSRRNAATQEAATKYFFLSIFASALLLYGLAFLYGSTGISNLKAVSFLIEKVDNFPQPQLGLIAVVFVMAGLCFRVAAVPMHAYAPDVYEGSPTVIAALLSWVPKAVGFLAIIRALTAAIGTSPMLVDKAVNLSWIIAAATMTLGNFVALLQDNLKRLLAYSSIAHAGYLMVGVAVAFADVQRGTQMYYGSEGILFYLLAYALMTLGTFGVIIAPPDRRSPGADGDGARRSGLDSSVVRGRAGDLLAQPQRHPAAPRLLGQVRGLLLGAGGLRPGRVVVVPRAGDHRHAERGDRRLLLSPDRGRDVPEPGQGARRSARGAGRSRFRWRSAPA